VGIQLRLVGPLRTRATSSALRPATPA
jgi:hypothetical protein